MKRRLFSLRLYYVLSFASLGVFLPFLPPWLEARGITGLGLGATMATLPAMGLIAPPLFGALADALGLRGYLLRVACAGGGLAFGAIALASALGRPFGFAALFLGVLVFAFFRAPMIPLADVICLEEVKTGSTSYARIRLWGSLGFLVSAITVGRFIDPQRPTALPVAIAASMLAALLAAFGLPARVVTMGPQAASNPGAHSQAAPNPSAQLHATSPPLPSLGHVRALLSSRDFPVFLVASLIAQAAHANYDLCYSLHLRDLGVAGTSVGVAWGIGVVAEVVTMALSAPLFARFQASRLLALAFAGAALRWLLIASARSEIALFAAQLMHALSFALMWLSSLAYIKDRVPPQILATAQGLFSASLAAGGAIGVLVWGPLYHRAGGAAAFGAASVVSALACALAVALSRASARRGG